MHQHQVQHLLMGGQACVFYGAAEFSRDTDLVVLADSVNLGRLGEACKDLAAECIAVPPFDLVYLDLGLAVHFRCRHPEAESQRIDVMSRLRGVDPFPTLWQRRTSIETDSGPVELLGLPDLVKAKKTQRDKDWPMIRRLVEAHYAQNREAPNSAQIEFWLRELRTPSLLLEVVERFPENCYKMLHNRALLRHALSRDEATLQSELKAEEEAERAADRAYWLPLHRELERLRQEARKKP
jgi:hypothetical protein